MLSSCHHHLISSFSVRNQINIRRVAETQMVSVRKRNIQGRYNSVRHLQRRYLNGIEYISGTKFTIITIFYNVYSKYNIPRKGQGKSTRDYRGLTNLRFSFARHQQSLLITNFPVKFIVIQNKSAVSIHWIGVANTECKRTFSKLRESRYSHLDSFNQSECSKM